MSDRLDTDSRSEQTGDEKQDTQEKEAVVPERTEEAKLKAKYPNLGQKPGGSDFLMKRLQKGQKYFDSGDYNMAKAKMKNKQLPSAGPDKNLVTGDHIPTPQDLPQRKSSLVTSKLAGEISEGNEYVSNHSPLSPGVKKYQVCFYRKEDEIAFKRPGKTSRSHWKSNRYRLNLS